MILGYGVGTKSMEYWSDGVMDWGIKGFRNLGIEELKDLRYGMKRMRIFDFRFRN